jgi:2-haloacid dehalogenase
VATELAGVRALAFDVGGTVFDWHRTVRTEVARLAAERNASVDAAAFAGEWRSGFFGRLFRMQAGEVPHTNPDGLYRAVLDDLADRHDGLQLNEHDRDELTRVWHRIEVWPDFPPALERLRTRYTVVVLTVFSWSIAVDASKLAGLTWDGILSCEFLDDYKPQAVAYEQCATLLGLEPREVMMVAAHPIDLHAASGAGLRTAYVDRPDEWGGGSPAWDPGTTDGIDVVTSNFTDLADQLLGVH